MRRLLIVLGISFCLFTCSYIGTEDNTDKGDEFKDDINISAEIDLPADMDIVVRKIANDVGGDLGLPNVIKVCYGEADDPIETVDSLYGVNMVSSRNDTLFILPKAFWENKNEHFSFKEAVETKLIEISN